LERPNYLFRKTVTAPYTIRFLLVVILATAGSVYAQSTPSDTRKLPDARSVLLEAKPIAQTLQNANNRNGLLRDIAESQTRAHDPEAALETLAACPGCSAQSSILVPIAGELAELGEIKRALELVNTIKSASYTTAPPGELNQAMAANALSSIALSQAKRGDIVGAQTSLKMIDPEHWPREEAVIAVASQQVNSGDWHGALQTIKGIVGFLWISEAAFQCMLEPRMKSTGLNSVLEDIDAIEDENTRMFALTGLVQVQLSNNDFAGSRQTAHKIAPGYPRASAFKSLAEASLRAGDKLSATQYLNEAVTAAKVMANDLAKADTLWRIAAIQAEAGNIDGALSTARPIEFAHHHINAIRDIVTAQVKAGNTTGALETASLLKRDRYEQEYEGTVCGAAYDLALSGQSQNAVQFASQALGRDSTSCTHNIINGQSQSGDIASARSTLNTVDSKDKRAIRLKEMNRLNGLLASTKDNKSALEKQISQLDLENYFLDDAWLDLATATAKTGDFKTALDILESLEHSARTPNAIKRIAGAVVAGGKIDKALVWARSLHDPLNKASAFIGVADAMSYDRTSRIKHSICGT
jgi:hypothetical protein